ncbi:alpha-1,2-fucosyltransferase [Tolypothrix sp. FACHB-123]|uniref:alpha-1,2-fucosyltransferase n=1 Tax=Tolypothrix sp. FACHB-123 TaxID=2692868 RepID=UPI0016872671|nr:alpha-1,2-fucosyltransferase [Tolypothrix sp. FACHB-123]MBD2359315.1 alpha-1,2-fucosyltransferase [Tolypothrix sp. FACHB-123]
MLVISAKSGQLGNRLLTFANFIAFSIENNLTVINPAFEEYADFFESTSKDFLCRYPPLRCPIYGNKFLRKCYYNFNRQLAESGKFNTLSIQRQQTFNWQNMQIINDLNLKSINFFQGWLFRDGWFVNDLPLLGKHRAKICAYFQPLYQYKVNVSKLMSQVRSQAEIVIGVHIRHGDYQQHHNGQYFYSVEEYVKVMKLAQNLFPHQKTIFLICSNEQHEKSYFQELSYVYGNNHIIEDMYALAECDYIIGPPSSYTMWASYYGDTPIYMVRDINKNFKIHDFVHFYQWKGVYYTHKDWSKNFWEWTH